MKTPRFMMTLLACAAILITLTQCGSDDPTPVKQPDVYVAGDYNTLAPNGYNFVPAYWKNGEKVQLGDATGGADAIAVIGDDVYVIGKLDDSDKKLRLWTNGQVSDLTDGANQCYVYGMKTFGNDWYAFGSYYIDVVVNGVNGISERAVYWKNGDIHIINSTRDASAYDLTVDGDDVYVAGFEMNAESNYAATIWKNDVGTNISSDQQVSSSAYGVGVLNGAVYATLNEGNSLKMWSDGAVAPLTSNGGTSKGSLVIIGTSVYVSGHEYLNGLSMARYWKNGVAFDLPTPASVDQSYGFTFATRGKDIFLLGEGNVGNTPYTLVWKNGELIEGYDGTNQFSAYSISVSN